MLLKVSIGTNIQDGPWGGGNLFAVNLSRYLKNKGHEVIYDLDDRDIDIILLTEPRKTSPSSAYTNFEIQNYIKLPGFGLILAELQAKNPTLQRCFCSKAVERLAASAAPLLQTCSPRLEPSPIEQLQLQLLSSRYRF